MNVALVLYGGLDERSGGFRYDRRLVEGLRAAGDTVDVVELPWRAYWRGLLDSATGRLRDRFPDGVDVLLEDELAHPSLLRVNRTLPYPVVSIVHHLRASEPRRLSPVYRAIEARYLDTVDAVVCNSTTTRSTVTDAGVPSDATVVAPPAGDRFDPDVSASTIARRARRDPFTVTFVGNIERRKGLDTLVEGLARADEPCDLTAVGRPVDGSYVATVRDQIRDAGLADRVELAGELTDSALASVLRESHLLAVPSRYEGFGIVYLEGMSFGLPAIATNAGGAADVVTDGETGVVVDPADPAAVGTALTALARDRERLATMGLAARRRYERHPDWSETTARVRSLLTDVAGPGAAG